MDRQTAREVFAQRRLAMVALVLFAVTLPAATAHAAKAKTVTRHFQAEPGSLGYIPDNTPSNQSCTADPLQVAFKAKGLRQPVSDVSVSISINHNDMGDLIATLISPGGGAAHTLFSRTGRPPWAGGYYSQLGALGPSGRVPFTYRFTDKAPNSPTWWDAADTAGIGAHSVAAGSYRATAPETGATTLITPSFKKRDLNGTWAVQFIDCGIPSAGFVSSAALTISAKKAKKSKKCKRGKKCKKKRRK